MTLLRSLRPTAWGRPTACALWSVKDIAAHLLDGNLRRLSFGRDGLSATPDTPVSSYADLVGYLNRLNADWTAATRHLSPRVLIELLDFTSGPVHAFFRSLDPHAPAHFGVAWAGEEGSQNWFDIGREYTERWLHQQQIREAVGAEGLTERRWLHPTLDIFIRALPFAYQAVPAPSGRSVRGAIDGEAGGIWTLVRGAESWGIFTGSGADPAATVSLDQGTAWKLFSKGLERESARRNIRIEGDPRLGEPLLGTLAVMA
ncbi:MAG: maleylpyruvate isomerase family mycothiol-dependent enzyme [Gemmatimonadota bacterium]|nr:maleylpyruvate isomerase family mycothiol-dependent enzyme [Gemmatimonadota bacterium]